MFIGFQEENVVHSDVSGGIEHLDAVELCTLVTESGVVSSGEGTECDVCWFHPSLFIQVFSLLSQTLIKES